MYSFDHGLFSLTLKSKDYFVKKVIIGNSRLLFKLIGWMGNPENGPKLEAIGSTFKEHMAAFHRFDLLLTCYLEIV